MFRDMRRKERQLSREQAERMLQEGQYGVLSVHGDDGYPYGVPMNYGYANGKIYLHCARSGHKLQALQHNPKVCFTVVSRHRLAEAEYTAYYASVVVFGRARILRDTRERHEAMEAMMSALSPDYMQTAVTDCGGEGYVMVEITPEHITGKSNL